jgi:hypothetical protein
MQSGINNKPPVRYFKSIDYEKYLLDETSNISRAGMEPVEYFKYAIFY